MKWDMGGAGAVVGAMKALALRKAKANIVGICGLVENMPGGNAQRPGDVVTTMSGQTVEVINTDAEGRLVLADAVTYVQRNFKPSTIIDLATLTGAILISLGHEWAGLFSNNDELAAQAAAGRRRHAATSLWRMPLAEPFDRLIDSPIADMKNVGPREGGSITAAQFIQRFIENGVRWAHIDMAGKAWSDKAEHDLRQGRDRLRRSAARPICRGRAGALIGPGGAGRFLSAAGSPAEQVIASIAEKVLAGDGRLLIVAEDEALPRPARPDAVGPGPTSFLPHGLAGGTDDARQPILLSTSPDAPNLARNMLIADGEWRDAALTYDRSFYLVRREHAGRRAARLEAAGRQGRGRAPLLGAGRAASGVSKA